MSEEIGRRMAGREPSKNIETTHCSLISSSIAATFSIFFFNVSMILVACKIADAFLRRLGQHRMISDFSIGLVVCNVPAIRSTVEEHVILTVNRMVPLCFGLYLFVLGLELDPITLLLPRRASAIVGTKFACVSIVSTVGITLLSYAAINFTSFLSLAMNQPFPIVTLIAVCISATSSPTLTRLITQLKINKSEIGRLAVRAALCNDLVCTSLVCFALAVSPSHPVASLVRFLFIALQSCLILALVNPLFGKINDRNIEGKPIRGLDISVASATAALLCASSYLVGFNSCFNAFFVGLCLRRDGRVSNFFINRINFIISSITLPIFMVLVGISMDIGPWVSQEGRKNVYETLVVGTIGAAGKITGTVAYGIRHGMQWQEAIAFGLLLNIKGYFHVFCAYGASRAGVIDSNTMMVMVLVTVGTVIPTPLVVTYIVRRARARESCRPPMGLQYWPSTAAGMAEASGRPAEARILVGLRGPEDVPMAASAMEAARGLADGGRGLAAFVVDMVEMTDKAAASLVHGGEGMEAVTVTEEGVVDMRGQIGSALDAYLEESGGGMRVRRMLAFSSFEDMHEDLCATAQDCAAVIIVLPFHRRQRVDGAMDGGHPGFRLVNQKVLQRSPCSVAIFLNRGLGRTATPSRTQTACAVFIGGPDDREALSYASLMTARHGVMLTVLRFVVDRSASRSGMSGPGRRDVLLSDIGRQEMEERADDEFFAGFYERNVGGGRKAVGYMERHVGSGAETVRVLREMEGQYQMFIVGRGKDRDSVLTAGMSDWAECPELGPIGDVLASSDFSVSASVVVIQQRDATRGFNVIDDEFLPL